MTVTKTSLVLKIARMMEKANINIMTFTVKILTEYTASQIPLALLHQDPTSKRSVSTPGKNAI